MASQLTDWTGEDVRLADVDHAIAQLRAATVTEGAQPSLRTSVMTHMAWVPEGWVEPARAALSGMAERHPSRTILLLPEPNAGADGRVDEGGDVERQEGALAVGEGELEVSGLAGGRCFGGGDREAGVVRAGGG